MVRIGSYTETHIEIVLPLRITDEEETAVAIINALEGLGYLGVGIKFEYEDVPDA